MRPSSLTRAACWARSSPSSTDCPATIFTLSETVKVHFAASKFLKYRVKYIFRLTFAIYKFLHISVVWTLSRGNCNFRIVSEEQEPGNTKSLTFVPSYWHYIHVIDWSICGEWYPDQSVLQGGEGVAQVRQSVLLPCNNTQVRSYYLKFPPSQDKRSSWVFKDQDSIINSQSWNDNHKCN